MHSVSLYIALKTEISQSEQSSLTLPVHIHSPPHPARCTPPNAILPTPMYFPPSHALPSNPIMTIWELKLFPTFHTGR